MFLRFLFPTFLLVSLLGCAAVSTVPPDAKTAAEVAAAVYDVTHPSTGITTVAGPSIGRAMLANGVYELRYTIAADRLTCDGPFLHISIFRPVSSGAPAIHPSSATSTDGTRFDVVSTESIDSGDGVKEHTVVRLPHRFLTRIRQTGTAIELHGSGTFSCFIAPFYVDGFIIGSKRILREQGVDRLVPGLETD